MEKNEYHLIIDINGDVGGDVISGGANEKVDNQQKALTRLVKYQIAQPYINATKQIVMNNVNTYFGSNELSQRIQVGLDTAHSLYGNIVSGASLGVALGIGTVAGAGIGVALMVGQKLLDIAVKQNEINNKAMLENQELNILRGRAGIQFNRSRVGE